MVLVSSDYKPPQVDSQIQSGRCGGNFDKAPIHFKKQVCFVSRVLQNLVILFHKLGSANWA